MFRLCQAYHEFRFFCIIALSQILDSLIEDFWFLILIEAQQNHLNS